MAKKAVRIGVSLALMVVLLAVFLWNVDFQEVGRSLAGADLTMLVAAALVALAAYWMRALRWQFILLPVGRVRHSSVLLTTAVGYAALSLLPARMGDLIRPLLLARREKPQNRPPIAQRHPEWLAFRHGDISAAFARALEDRQ